MAAVETARTAIAGRYNRGRSRVTRWMAKRLYRATQGHYKRAHGWAVRAQSWEYRYRLQERHTQWQHSYEKQLDWGLGYIKEHYPLEESELIHRP